VNTSLQAGIKPQFQTIDGLRIRYADSGGWSDQTILCTSPWPESLYAFAPIWETLTDHARVFAVDLPGFGGSERREDLLSPRAMGEFLARLVAEAALPSAHIVAPDVGTSAALFAAAAHPDLFSTVTVGTGGAAVPIQLGEPLASWVLDPDFEKYRQMDAGEVVGAALDTIEGGLPEEIRADYLDCYAGTVRGVDALRPQLPRGAAGAGRAAAPDLDAGHDHRGCPGPRRPHSRTRSSSTSGCPRAISWSSTRATSSGKRRRRSTRRPSGRADGGLRA
jgi:pimeloyl-ACP methyl ester carboxylesterase